MTIPHQTEVDITQDVEALRERFTRTQELYREVSALLFFRYGVTPTANKLYQLVRKGSMSAPTDALNKFWADIREKSRTRIEHPDLPDTLKTAAGELVAQLWTKAQGAADESLNTYQSEADDRVQIANALVAKSETKLESKIQELQNANSQLEAASKTINTLREEIAMAGTTNDSLNASLEQSEMENGLLKQKIEALRIEFALEVEKLREALEIAEKRFQANEKRILLDLDRERMAVVRLNKELDTSISSALRSGEKHKDEILELHQALGDCRHQNGHLTEALQSKAASLEHAEFEINRMRIDLKKSSENVALVRKESGRLRKKLETIQKNPKKSTRAIAMK
ncbi:DNA-binding protein [Advenella kashmirensis]